MSLACFILLMARDDVDETYERDAHQFQVTAVDNDGCNLILIEFREEDLDAVRQITGSDDLKYYVLNPNKILVYPVKIVD